MSAVVLLFVAQHMELPCERPSCSITRREAAHEGRGKVTRRYIARRITNNM